MSVTMKCTSTVAPEARYARLRAHLSQRCRLRPQWRTARQQLASDSGCPCRKRRAKRAVSAKAQESWLLQPDVASPSAKCVPEITAASFEAATTQNAHADDKDNDMQAKGGTTASAPLYCFPPAFQLPALNSPELTALLETLHTELTTEPEPSEVRLDNLSAITRALQNALAMPSAAKPPPVQSVLTETSNRADTFSSSGSARTDLFFQCEGSGSYARPNILYHLLQQAWEEDPLDTLKLIAHLRDVRDGKAEQKAFRQCVAWLYEEHPVTLVANLLEVVKVGYWKDLLDILVQACISKADMDDRAAQQGQVAITKSLKKKGLSPHPSPAKPVCVLFTFRETAFAAAGLIAGAKPYPVIATAKEEHPELKEMTKKPYRKHFSSLKTDDEKAHAKKLRAQQVRAKHVIIERHIHDLKQAKWAQLKSNAQAKYMGDAKYRLLHISVAKAFAEQLQQDLQALKEKRLGEVSLAAKWAPTAGKSHDKDTFIASSIAELLFPASTHQKTKESRAAYARRTRELYRKTVLVPLRKCLDVPEVYMSANMWGDIKYNRVTSVCMNKNKDKFEAHDQERFKEYLSGVEAGKKKIASGALKPHELVQQAMQHAGVSYGTSADKMSETSLKTMELQWRSYVNNLKTSGTLSNALAICDVSGSMQGQPMEVAIALSLLVADVTAAPFNNAVCTFSSSPQLHEIAGQTLVDKVRDLSRMDWGMSTDLNEAFDLILERACKAKLAPAQMLDTVFVFSDMQFDQATYPHNDDSPDNDSSINFKVAQESFAQHGYKLPKVVFWNLRGPSNNETASVPVTHREEGTALVSGFSGQLLKLFMGGAAQLETFDPFNIMQAAIAAERYNAWRVVD